LAPCRFSVSPIDDKIERPPFWHNWGDRGRIADGVENLTELDFQDAFKQWQKFWERRIRAKGDYLEVMVASKPKATF
jgi:hypothetical protein